MTEMRLDFDAMPTLAEIPRYHARERAERPAMTFEGRTISWVELDAGASRVANALVAAGCRTGDRVAYLGKGTDEFFELMFGIAKAGAVIAPIQWRLATPEVVQILGEAQPRRLFVGSEQIEEVDQLCAGPDGFPRESVIAMENGGAGLKRYRDWSDEHSAADPGSVVDSGAVALQLYTSGTTGLPKGVMLSHRNILSGRREAQRERMEWNEWLEDDVNLVALPVGHIGRVGWAIVGSLNGALTIVQRELCRRRCWRRSSVSACRRCSSCRRRCTCCYCNLVCARSITAACDTSCIELRRLRWICCARRRKCLGVGFVSSMG
jgi:acyl-CoA synthetase (AMP-forming)/AMP-acid ligase II